MIFSSKLWVLFISYFVWLTGEVIFLSTNAEWASYMNLFVIVALIYFVLLTAILIILRLSIKIGDAPEPNHKSKKNGESSQSSTQ